MAKSEERTAKSGSLKTTVGCLGCRNQWLICSSVWRRTYQHGLAPYWGSTEFVQVTSWSPDIIVLGLAALELDHVIRVHGRAAEDVSGRECGGGAKGNRPGTTGPDSSTAIMSFRFIASISRNLSLPNCKYSAEQITRRSRSCAVPSQNILCAGVEFSWRSRIIMWQG